jgi:hypothetical protein
VFSKLKDRKIVSKLLNRVSLFNQVFGYGKVHAVAKVTAKELEYCHSGQRLHLLSNVS